MEEKKEIIEKDNEENGYETEYMCENCGLVQSYLKAIEEANELAEVLKLFEYYTCRCRLIPGSAKLVRKCDACFAKEALAKWKKEK